MRLDFSSFDLTGIDWSPLRISCAAALIATAATFLLGLWAAWRLYRMRRRMRVVLDCLLTLPLVLPPTVMGLILLMIFGRQSLVGRVLEALGTQVVFSFGATVICAVAVTFPLMYRTGWARLNSSTRTCSARRARWACGRARCFSAWRCR